MAKTPVELIEVLKSQRNVLGILEYGSRPPGAADTDLCVVVSERPRGLESVHFWLKSGPVDLNVRTLRDLRGSGLEREFDDALREGTILWERETGTLSGLCARAQACPLGTSKLARMRHGHAHYLTKLTYYRDRKPLLCHVLLCGAVHWLLRSYAAIHGLRYEGEKAVLRAIEENAPAIYAQLEALFRARSLSDKIEELERITAEVLEPIGGPWRRGEVLYFDAPHEEAPDTQVWHRFFESLLDPGRT
jgi:hypothetical protein